MKKFLRNASIVLASKLSHLCDAFLTDGATVTTSHTVSSGTLDRLIDKNLW